MTTDEISMEELEHRRRFAGTLGTTALRCGIEITKHHLRGWYQRLHQFPVEQIEKACERYESQPGGKFLGEFYSFILRFCESPENRPNTIERDGVTLYLTGSIGSRPIYRSAEECEQRRLACEQRPKALPEPKPVEREMSLAELAAVIHGTEPTKDEREAQRKAIAELRELMDHIEEHKMATMAATSEGGPDVG